MLFTLFTRRARRERFSYLSTQHLHLAQAQVFLRSILPKVPEGGKGIRVGGWQTANGYLLPATIGVHSRAGADHLKPEWFPSTPISGCQLKVQAGLST